MFAMPKKTFLADENRVHAELMRLARAGQITYYSALGAAVGKPARWSLWTLILERISDDELAKGNPDITNLVLSAKTGWLSGRYPGESGHQAAIRRTQSRFVSTRPN